MTSLLKRDFIINKAALVSGLFLIPIGYLITLPPFFISLGLMLPVIFIHLFFLDHHANINRYIISLPVTPKAIVTSRYLYFVVAWVFVIFYQFITGHIIEGVSDYGIYVFNWKEIISLFSLGLAILAFYMPLHYLFKSFITVSIIITVSYFIIFLFSLDTLVDISGMTDTIIFNDLDRGIVPLIEKILPFQPYLSLPLIALTLYYFSMKLSEKAFSVK